MTTRRTSSRARSIIGSYAEHSESDDKAPEEQEEEEEEFVADRSRKRSASAAGEDEGEDEAPAALRKRTSSGAAQPVTEREKELVESERWRVASGERTRSSSTGQLLLNPTITTEPLLPITDNDAARVKLVSFNVNGLRGFLEKASFKKYMDEEQPDLLAIQETKSNNSKGKGAIDLSAHVDMARYHHYWCHADTPGYSGTLVLSRFAPLSVLDTMPVASTHSTSTTDRDGRVLALEFPRCWVVSLYVPNSAEKLKNLPYRRDWNKSVQSFLHSLSKPAFVMGDFNVAHAEADLHNPKANVKNAGFTPEERADFQTLLDSGFVDVWRKQNPDVRGAYSYWGYRHNARASNKGWRVDYVLAHAALEQHVEKAFIRKEMLGSDHCPVGVMVREASLFQ